MKLVVSYFFEMLETVNYTVSKNKKTTNLQELLVF